MIWQHKSKKNENFYLGGQEERIEIAHTGRRKICARRPLKWEEDKFEKICARRLLY